MNHALETLFNQLESQRSSLLEEVRKQPQKFDVKPHSKKWSVHQILSHLVAAEKLTVLYLRKKVQGIDEAGDSGVIEELKMITLKISQRLPFKFTAPSAVVENTRNYSSLEELIEDWDSTRENFRQILEKVNDHQLKRKIYKHLVVGRLNILHAVKFSREHIIHHWPQVNRILKK